MSCEIRKDHRVILLACVPLLLTLLSLAQPTGGQTAGSEDSAAVPERALETQLKPSTDGSTDAQKPPTAETQDRQQIVPSPPTTGAPAPPEEGRNTEILAPAAKQPTRPQSENPSADAEDHPEASLSDEKAASNRTPSSAGERGSPAPGKQAEEPSEPSEPNEQNEQNEPNEPAECANLCLNGGRCVLELGRPKCICRYGFFGVRCQSRNLCETIVADNLNGDAVCARVGRGRACIPSDKLFRCECDKDEYFVFKADYRRAPAAEGAAGAEAGGQPDAGPPGKSSSQARRREPSYLAECRKKDKCLGVRCRQTSEVCHEGACVCNENLGYIRDPRDGLCKLLDPCEMATADGLPICGQAKCVATYDRELYRCVCPLGYNPIKVGEHRSSIQCALLTNMLCEIPLLNNCQHECRVDRRTNTYKCFCLPGYKPGTRPDIDDNMCFFDEHLNEPPGVQTREASPPSFRLIERPVALGAGPTLRPTPEPEPAADAEDEHASPRHPPTIWREKIIKREPERPDGRAEGAPPGYPGAGGETAAELERQAELSGLSVQERCNMYCEENKICVLEPGSRDSYRCICDRQGYVSVGDRCLDWCSAAEFSHSVQSLLSEVCYSAVCRRRDSKPPRAGSPALAQLVAAAEGIERARLLASARSSWRPAFECDCTSSPLLVREPATGLCKIDFRAILRPCLPGNEGHVDCVQNKHSYCVVLHGRTGNFFRNLYADRVFESQPKAQGATNGSAPGEPVAVKAGAKKARAREKLYTCVCSPDKKFLVDKPRNKARCIDECDLLSNECGRFNRMCRAATIESERDFGYNSNLIRLDRDGVRMNRFKRTGCECLPGFNVGPTEARDFTLDDNYPELGARPAASSALAASVWPSPEALALSEQSAQHWQVMDAYELFQEPASAADITGLLAADFSAPELAQLRTKYMNINSRCLLDYDVVEFHASFKAPADFEPAWVEVRPASLRPSPPAEQLAQPQQPAPSTSGLAESIEALGGRTVAPETTRPLPAQLEMPAFMHAKLDELHQHVVLVDKCDYALAQLSLETFRECLRYRYWVVQKLRHHFVDWRRVMSRSLKETFSLMDGNIRFRVNKCAAHIKQVATVPAAHFEALEAAGHEGRAVGRISSANIASGPATAEGAVQAPPEVPVAEFDPFDPFARVDADVECELTIHSASDDSGSRRHARKVLLEKQLPRFIFDHFESGGPGAPEAAPSSDYYLMAPNTLIQRDSFDQLALHRKVFSPCRSDYAYCDKQTRCEMVDSVNYSCTCDYGYTPIGSRDIYINDSRKEVCEDIDECLFDVCKENGLENKSTCVNEIGDYKCQCMRHHVGDNKRYCNHICNVIACKYGDCRIPDEHHAFCECHEGYREADCSVLDPSVALRKANMIICGSIFASVLMLAITLAISLSSQLKKTKKKLKRLEAAQDAAEFLEFNLQQAPFTRQRVSKTSIGN